MHDAPVAPAASGSLCRVVPLTRHCTTALPSFQPSSRSTWLMRRAQLPATCILQPSPLHSPILTLPYLISMESITFQHAVQITFYYYLFLLPY